jgi:arginyl-tRNA--protein-N-Asp/Glu arginylyltransferase
VFDVVKYKFVKDNDCDYNGKRMTIHHTELRKIHDKIDAYQKKFFDDNDLNLSFTVPKSHNSCHQRARLITSEQLAVFDDYLSKLERVHLKWHKHYEQMKEKFKAYAELIRSSKNLEQVVEVWSEAENVRHKITGTGTALALSSISQSVIQQDMEERKLADTVAVVITNTESVGV